MLALHGVDPASVYSRRDAQGAIVDSPFLVVDLPSCDLAAQVVRRCVQVHSALELLAEGVDYDELRVGALANRPLLDPYMLASVSWQLQVQAFGRSLTAEEQEAKRLSLSETLPLPGPVRLRNPDQTFVVVEDVGLRRDRPLPPRRLFMGRLVGGGAKALVSKLDLKKRSFLGPTSLVPQLALLMANLARVTRGAFVMDPFAGTGSVAVAVAELGGEVLAADIDLRVLRGKQGRTMTTMFRAYGLGVPEVVRMDNSCRCLRELPMFHAVICDPPYGIRAGARKTGSPGMELRAMSPEERLTCVPATSVYDAFDVMKDLLDMSARMLVLGGRLAYLLPCTSVFTPDELPVHPCLATVANCEEKLTLSLSRRVIVMEKVSEYAYDQAVAYAEVADAHRAKGPSYADIAARLQAAREERERDSAAAAGVKAGAGSSHVVADREDVSGSSTDPLAVEDPSASASVCGAGAGAGSGVRAHPKKPKPPRRPRSDRVGEMPFDKF